MITLPIVEEEVVQLTALGTNDYLDGKRIIKQEVWEVIWVCVYDATNDVTTIFVGPYNGATHFKVAAKTPTAAYDALSIQGPIYIKPTQNLRAHIVGATASDDLYMYYQFIRHYLEE